MSILFAITTVYLSSSTITPGVFSELLKLVQNSDSKTLLIVILLLGFGAAFTWMSRQHLALSKRYDEALKRIQDADERSALERERNDQSEAAFRQHIQDTNKQLMTIVQGVASVRLDHINPAEPDAPEQIIEAVRREAGGEG